MSERTVHPAPTIGLTLRSLLRADFTTLLRSRQGVLLNLLVPLIFVFVTGLPGRQRIGDPGVLIGLAITYGLISAGMLGYSLTIAKDRDNRVFQRLRVTPTPTWTIMGSRIVVQLVSAVVMSIIVLIIGSVLHHVGFAWYQYLAMLAVSLLGAIVFLSIGQAIVGLLQSSTAINAVGRVLYILFILSGILGVTGALGDGFKAFAGWTPVGALVYLYAAALGAPWSADTTSGLLASLAYCVVFGFVGIRWFRWDSR